MRRRLEKSGRSLGRDERERALSARKSMFSHIKTQFRDKVFSQKLFSSLRRFFWCIVIIGTCNFDFHVPLFAHVGPTVPRNNQLLETSSDVIFNFLLSDDDTSMQPSHFYPVWPDFRDRVRYPDFSWFG